MKRDLKQRLEAALKDSAERQAQPSYSVALITENGDIKERWVVFAPTGHDAIMKVDRTLKQYARRDIKFLEADRIH